MFLKKFLFAIVFVSIAMTISIAGYLFFAKQRPALAQIVGENIYISQSGNGSQDGSDCNNAHPVLWFNTVGNWANPKQVGKIGPGDTAHLCGIFTGFVNTTMLTIQVSGSVGNVITLKFESGTIFTSPQWSSDGAINVNGKDYINITGQGISDLGTIKNTDNGTAKTYQARSTGINTNGGSNIEISYLNIYDIYNNVSTISTGDMSGQYTSNILIDDNSGNWSDIKVYGCTLNAARAGVWVNFEGITATNVEIYNNYISDHGWTIVIGAGVNNSVITGVDIHNNELTSWTNWYFPYHTDGLIIYSNAHTNSSYTGKFRNNYVHGNLMKYSPSGFIGTGCGGQNFLIDNNLFVCDNLDGNEGAGSCMSIYNSGGCYASQSDPNAGYQPINTQFYNNTVIGTTIQKNSQSGYALKVARALTNINGSGNYMQVKNNIFQTWNVAMHDVNVGFEGFSGSGSSDNNLYYDFYPYATMKIIRTESGGTTHSISTFCSTYSQDCNSVSGNPLFVSSYDFHLQSGSPARDAGVNLGSYFQIDKDGISRPQGLAWDIGAYEYIQASSPLKGDFNSDSKVNNLDFTSFKNAFKSIFNSIFDLNSDNTIDVKDLGVLMSSWQS